MTLRTSFALLGAAAALLASMAQAGPLDKTECIAPAKPGGGFDLTCKLAQIGLKDSGLLKAPMRVTYMPGGVGAVAYNAIVAQRPGEPGTVVAFSGGSLLNLASEYTSQVAVDGDIMTTLAQNLADFVTEFQTYGVRFAYVLKRLADLLERVKGVVLEYDTTIDPLIRQMRSAGSSARC